MLDLDHFRKSLNWKKIKDASDNSISYGWLYKMKDKQS